MREAAAGRSRRASWPCSGTAGRCWSWTTSSTCSTPAPLVADLLAACAGLAVCVTSRAVLRVSGEHAVAVPPLGLPALERRFPIAAVARNRGGRGSSSNGRAAARDDFALTDANAGAVAEICRRLDGLPLAIELAAARVRYLPPAALLARLEPRLPLLTGGARDQPAACGRCATRSPGATTCSTPDEQALFRRLAVFAGGFTLEAPQAGLRRGWAAPSPP